MKQLKSNLKKKPNKIKMQTKNSISNNLVSKKRSKKKKLEANLKNK